MEFFLENNKIIITDLGQFHIQHILECGQVFRFKKLENCYEVISGAEFARIFTYENKVEIECTNVDYFINYFDLETDYNLIKNELNKMPILKTATDYAYGLRILKQNKLETVIEFIISANNNLKRIQNSMLELSARYGTKMVSEVGEYFAFPTLEKLSQITLEEWVSLKVGYRAPHLVKAVQELKNFDLEALTFKNSLKAQKELVKLPGIGVKVADCILLFAYYKTDVVPVDTWVEKVYLKYFKKEKATKNRAEIRKELVKQFQNLSGFAQQYLFYYERENG